jgi:hypothetical protein
MRPNRSFTASVAMACLGCATYVVGAIVLHDYMAAALAMGLK